MKESGIMDHETVAGNIVNLCRSCDSILRQGGRYNVRKIDTAEIKTIRQCSFCHHRVFCGKYELLPATTNKKKSKTKAEIVAEEIAEEIKDRNL